MSRLLGKMLMTYLSYYNSLTAMDINDANRFLYLHFYDEQSGSNLCWILTLYNT